MAKKKKASKGKGKPAVLSIARGKGSIRGKKTSRGRARRSAKISKSGKRSYR